MNCAASRLLARALVEPETPHTAEWEAIIHRAREADLLGTIARRISARGLLDQVPPGPRAHLVAAIASSNAQHRAVLRETAEIARALQPLGVPLVLLKGAAYVLGRLPAARGRSLSDIDLLVPKSALPAVESALMLAGYATTHHHPHDQRYYRRWMHEIPPMQHVKRLTVVDVHHAITPQLARGAQDATSLFRAAVPLDDPAGFSILAPADMVLHSASHLFDNEEFTHGLRDLVDLDALLRHFGRDPGFWSTMTTRAIALRLERPLHYALEWTSRLLGTPMPGPVARGAAAHVRGSATGWLMEMLIERALQPDMGLRSVLWARRALYIRGYWLKLPVPLLAWHLTAKAFRRQVQPA
jgi:hypothetical protein